ncbi:MAG: bifunctional pyr operon transcriptional regulator/uracil phosphoribosyltransferase PyrR [Halothiobacillaceae bacterium]|jgi:pyrimidine operon attenuation protein/uracil phosphoribosyltransferase|nr:bifunctional pyr operon transcriptional regulator/uracil phosphoribosyltransferase PyrR [Halothiobacillaceae bacterium]
MAAITPVETLIDRLSAGLRENIEAGTLHDPLMVGIHSGGVWVAERLHAKLGLSEPLGKLNIAFYRDDFTHIGLHPQVSPSSLPFDIEGRDIVLVDDVLYTGRTIRAAMNELFDFGRPARVLLAVLYARNGRELPIQADLVGESLTLGRHEHIHLHGPEPLTVTIEQSVED